MFKIGKVAAALVESLEKEPKKWAFDHYNATRTSKKTGNTISMWIANGPGCLKLEYGNECPLNYSEKRYIFKAINIARENEIIDILEEK